MNGIAMTTGKISALIKGLQSGKVQNYAIYFFGGIIAIGSYVYLFMEINEFEYESK